MMRSFVDRIRGRIGVRLRLSLLALAAIVPLFVLLVAGLAANRESAVEAARTRALDLAHLIAERQDEGLRQAKKLLNVLRKMPSIVENAKKCHETLKAIVEDQPEFGAIGIAGSDGQIFCHSMVTAPMAFADAGFLGEVSSVAPNTFKVSEFRIGAITGRPTLFVATPIKTGGAESKPGVIFAALNLDRSLKAVHQFAGSEDWRLMILDTHSGNVLTGTPNNYLVIRNSFAGHPLTEAMRGKPEGGWIETEDFDGVKRIYGFAPLPFDDRTNFIAGVGLEASRVLADANHRMTIGLTLAVIAAIGAACAAWFLGDLWQLHPIQVLVKAARKLGTGDFSTRVDLAPWHAPEFRALGDTLNEMASGIAAVQTLLVQREAQLRLLAENATDLVFQLDLNLVRRYISPACLEILGFTPEELLGTTPLDMIHPDDRPEVEAVFQKLIQGEIERTSLIYRKGHREGHWLWVHSEIRLLRDEKTRQPTGILGAVRDISALKAAEDALRESESRYRLLADNAADLIICLNLDLKPVYVSPASRAVIGCEADELIAGSLEDFAFLEDLPFLKTALHFLQERGVLDDFRFRVRHRERGTRWIEMSGRKAVGGDSIVLVLHDITIRQKAEEQLEKANNQLRDLASRDFLTELANRRALETLLEKEFRRAKRDRINLALIMIDVDRFKAYNDVYGHPAGDVCLRKIAHAIEGALQRPSDLAARYGGEEIAILLPDTDEAGAYAVAERIRSVILDLKIEHQEGVGGIATISAGVAAFIPNQTTQFPDDLVNAADQALYAAKEAGRNSVALASHQAGVTLFNPRQRRQAG